MKRPAKRWSGKVKDALGGWRIVTLCENKEASRQLLAKLQSDAALAEHGLEDRYAEHRKKPLREHLADYERFLAAKNNAPEHIQQTISQCRALIEGTGARFLPDLDAAKAADWLAGRRRDGMGISTSNHYLTAVKGFAKWLVKAQR